MTGQEVFHGLGDSELDIQHPTVAQDHHKEAQPALGLPDGDGAARAPSALGTLSGSKGALQERGRALGADGADRGWANGIAPVKALLAQALEDLGGRVGIARQPVDNVRFARIEFAGTRGGLAWPAVVLGQPIGHGARIERECLGNLCGVQALGRVEVFDRAAAVIVDHPNPSQMRANTALMSPGSSSAATGAARGMAPWGAVSRAKP